MALTDFPESQKIVEKPDPVTRNLPWVEKYRPQKLTDLISHADILGELNTETPPSLAIFVNCFLSLSVSVSTDIMRYLIHHNGFIELAIGWPSTLALRLHEPSSSL